MRLLKESVLYTIGTGLGRGLPFLLMPVLTVHLSVADYGKLSIATTLAGFLAIIVGMNPNLYVFANYFRHPRNVMAEKIFNILLVAITSCIPVLAVYTGVSDLLAKYSITLGMYVILVGIALSRAVAAMHLAVDQMERKPKSYFVFYLIMGATIVSLIAALIVNNHFDWRAPLAAELMILSLLNVVYLARLKQRGLIKVWPNLNAVREYTNFSIPLLAHATALWGISFVDRFVIGSYVGMEAVGAYSVAHTTALGLSLMHESIHRAWQPVFFKKMQVNDNREYTQIVRYTWIYYGFTIVVGLVYFLIAYVLLHSFLPHEYSDALTFLPVLLGSASLLGMYRFVAGYYYHYQHTTALAAITIGCGLVHVVSTMLFVSNLGAIGAAYAGLLSYFVLWLLVKIMVARRYGVNWAA